jgi:predicted AlkP superfamily phosphohydrolase/phosphomutase
LIQELQAWRHPQTGEPIVEKAFRREEVYTGPCLQEAADIIVKWALCQNYSYAFRISSKSPRRATWIEQVDPNEVHNLEFFTGKSGTHRDYGIFLAHGAAIRPGFTIDGAKIIDLAPTILALTGVPVPNDMDGRVLEEIFVDGYAREAAARQEAPALVSAPSESPDYAEANGHYSSEDEEKIAERLKSLGYME